VKQEIRGAVANIELVAHLDSRAAFRVRHEEVDAFDDNPEREFGSVKEAAGFQGEVVGTVAAPPCLWRSRGM
jgi:hypothetical protein